MQNQVAMRRAARSKRATHTCKQVGRHGHGLKVRPVPQASSRRAMCVPYRLRRTARSSQHVE